MELLDQLQEEEVLVLDKTDVKPNYTIVVYNDDVNTFDHVIEVFMKYCNHNKIQAEQCAHIVHYKGKCAVKNGEVKVLKPICETLLEKHLTAKIELH